MAGETQVVAFTKPGYPVQDVIHFTSKTLPEINEEQVLVQVKAAALNPVDIQAANFFLFNWTNTSTEKVLGRDYSGVVLEAGSRSGFSKGDEVMGLVFDANFVEGCLATHIVVNGASSPIVKKPAGLDYVQAASLPLVWLTSYTALVEYGRLKPQADQGQGKRVVVIGASGGTGLYGLQVAKALCGATEAVAVCSSKNAELVRSRGADIVVAYDQENVLERLLALGPFDVMYDCVGGVDLIPHLSKLCKPSGGGWVSIVGEKHERSQVGGAITNLWSVGQLWRYYLGRFGFMPPYNVINLTPSREYLQSAVDLFESGQLEVDVDSIYPFTEEGVHQAFARLDTGRVKGKVVVSMERREGS